MRQILLKGWIAKDDDEMADTEFFETKPKKEEWYWKTKEDFFGDNYIELYPWQIPLKPNELRRCKIIIEIE